MYYSRYASHLFSLGYQPIPIVPGAKYPANKRWQQEVGLEALNFNIARYPNHGIGINNINAIDVDIQDPAISNLIELKIGEIKPNYIRRDGLKPKFLVPISPNSILNRKMKSSWKDGSGQKFEIELLHKHQQQFVAFAIHPDTNMDYTWTEPNILSVPAAQLDVWTDLELKQLMDYFDKICSDRGYVRSGPSVHQTPGWTAEQLAMLAQRPEWIPVTGPGAAADMAIPTSSNLTPMALEVYLNFLPQSYVDDYDSWIRAGGAIHYETDGSAEGLNLFDEWSKRSSKYNGRDEIVFKWESFSNRAGGTTGGTITHWLREAGTLATADAKIASLSNPEGVAVAHEDIADTVLPVSDLRGMVDQFVFITKGSKVGSLMNRMVYSLADFKAFMKPLQVRNANGNGSRDMSNVWLGTSSRQTVADTIYFPDKKRRIITREAVKYFNEYRPPHLEPVPFEMPVIRPYLDHMRFILPTEQSYELMLNWLAFSVQRPWERIPWAYLIVTPEEGVGKNFIFDMINMCLGRDNCSVVTKKELDKNTSFNSYMSRTTMVLWDEISARGLDYDDLKLRVTAKQYEVNHKNGHKGQEDIYCNFLMFTNDPNALQIPEGDRHFYVTRCDELSRTDPKSDKYDPQYYEKLAATMDGTMPAQFLDYLLKRDLSKFNPYQRPPMTDAKDAMIGAAVSDTTSDLENLIASRRGPCMFDITGAKPIADFINDENENGPRVGAQQISRELNKLSDAGFLKCKQYTVPDLGDMKTPKRGRVVCVRNKKKWLEATPQAIGLEYSRSLLAATGAKTKQQIEAEPVDWGMESVK